VGEILDPTEITGHFLIDKIITEVVDEILTTGEEGVIMVEEGELTIIHIIVTLIILTLTMLTGILTLLINRRLLIKTTVVYKQIPMTDQITILQRAAYVREIISLQAVYNYRTIIII
jgi:hypothetical protein